MYVTNVKREGKWTFDYLAMLGYLPVCLILLSVKAFLLRYDTHHTIHLFKEHNSLVFSMLTELCSHHHINSRTFLPLQNKPLAH